MRRILVILWMLCFGLLSAQTYHIGDVYTAPDGSQGIVYYLHPDGSGGWVVALNDASTGCPWGDTTDVPELVNVTSYYSQYMLADTAGYSNTQIIRNYQNNNTAYAAGKVDFDNGWVLPSASQLLMLYGQLPFISSALMGAGGTEPTVEAYWTSTERDSSSAYAVFFSFGYKNDVIKSHLYHVRAVRSFTNEPNYLWSTGDTTATITVSPSQTTEYTVTVTTQGGCTGTASKVITTQPPTGTNTHVFLCSDSTTTLTARAADSYLWNNGANTRSITVSNAGFYLVTATSAGEGCQTVDTFQVTTVKVNGISDINIPPICAGESTSITVGHDATCNVTIVNHETILALNDTVFLPDGVECAPYGCSYQSSLTFAGYEDNAHVNSVDDIRYLRVNMEHSYSGDLYINITCPNGQKADILKWGYYSLNYYSDCALQIPDSSRGWQSDTGSLNNAVKSTYFGLANRLRDSSFPCDPTRPSNAHGTGWNYCWSNNTVEGYTYAPGTGSLIYREANAHINESITYTLPFFGPTHPYVFDSSNVATGSQFYHPDDSFEKLVGCPLNGSWYIEVIDGNSVDNGYIFGWELALAPDIQTIEYVDVVNTTVDGPWVTATSDSSFLFSPPANLAHDTTVNYTFHCHSQFSCGYDTMVQVTFYPRQNDTIDTVGCNSIVWNGITYSADTTFTDSLTNIYGCDSILTVQLHVINTSAVTINGPEFFCAGDSVTLAATVDVEPQSYLWSTGDTTPTITVSAPGIYTVTAYYAGGCDAESANFQLFESMNPIVDAYLSNMVAGDTQIVVIGMTPDANLQYHHPQSIYTYSTVTFLPDGVPCEPLGCSYKAEMFFSDFPDSAVIHSAEDIRYLRLKMEHSAPIDLYINLTCPDGRQADILKKYNGNSTSECLSSIGPTHKGWPGNNVQTVYNVHYPHVQAWMGEPDISGAHNSSAFPCDSSINKPGVGWNYCWSNNTTEGYQYASSNGCLVDTGNALLYYSGNIAALSYLNKIILDSSNVAAGSQFYHPDVSFDSLVGCPINGTWIVEVMDGIKGDNGYIFESELAIVDYPVDSQYVELLQMDFDSAWVTRINDSVFIITPPASLTHDTTVTYTFTLVDENGCVFDTTVTITICVPQLTVLYDTICAGDTFDFHGQLLTEQGIYYDSLQTMGGCDSLVMLDLAVGAVPEVSILTISDTVCVGNPFTLQTSVSDSGMVYLWNTGDTTASITITPSQTANYQVTVTSAFGCVATASKTVEAKTILSTNTQVFLCENDTDTLTARANASYYWSTGDTAQSIVVSGMGFYTVTATLASGCPAVDTFEVISMQVNGVSHIDIPDMCAGGSYTIMVGNHASSNMSFVTHETKLALHDTVFLPDGIYCEPYGCSYRSPLTFAGYADTAHVNSVNDIRFLRINMEHSYGSDLYIRLVCPNGQSVDVLRWGNSYSSSQNSECSDSIPQSSCGWRPGGSNAWTSTRFGLPVHSYVSNDYPCDPTYFVNAPGVGWNYCWSNNSNYSYAPGAGSLIYRTVNAHYTSSYNKTFDSSNVASGTQFYHPDDSFDNLVGCPLNGDWYVEVMDGMQDDNGYIFGWELALAEDIQTVEYVDVVQTEVIGPYVTATSDSSFLFSPPDTLTRDTTINYIFHFTSQAGCSYDTVVEVTFYVPRYDTIAITECDSITWNGITYTADTTVTDTLTTIHGCDSLLTVHLHVLISPPVTVTGPQFICADSSVTLTATVNGEPQSYLWSNGETDSAITVHEIGIYSVTVFFENGCSTESADFQLLESENPILDVLLSDMVAGDTQTVTIDIQAGASIGSMQLDGPWVVSPADSIFRISPPDTLTNDTIVTYTFTLVDGNGCPFDTTVSITIYTHRHTDLYETVSASELPYNWNGVVFTHAGCQDTLLYTSFGSDSVVTMHLSVKYIYDTAVCENFTPLYWHSQTFISTSSVTISHTLDCADSIEIIKVAVHSIYRDTLSQAICVSDTPFIWHGRDYTFSGTYYDSLTAVVTGCDSLFVLNLTVNPVYRDTTETVICESDTPFVWRNHYFDTTGIYYDSLVNPVTGCDSIYVLSLTVNQIFRDTTIMAICESDTPFIWRNNHYDITGIYHDTVFVPLGCDSIFILNLTVSQTVPFDTFAVACDSFVWRGVIYHETPAIPPTDTLYGGSVSGCDSVTILHLVIHHSFNAVDSVSICEGELPYIYADTVFQEGSLSGEYVFHGTTTYGCDSIVTLQLQVTPNIHITQVPFIICESMLPADWFGHYIPIGTSGDTTIIDTFHFASNGCDSIVTRKLIIGATTYNTIVDTVVQNQLPYTLNGKTYDTTGIYHDTTMNIAGCDSLITLNLTVFYNDTTILDSTICSSLLPYFSWNGVTFTGTDTQMVVLPASTGADSTVVMRLLVNESPEVTISGPSVLCADSYAELTAVATDSVTFLWNTGATTPSIDVYTIGVYSVTVTNEYGCTDTDTLPLNESVTVNPIESYQFPDLCAGNDHLITIGHQSTCTIILENPESTLTWADTVFLPDGVYCSPYGCSYQSPLTFTDFAPGSTVSSVNDILYVRLNMEHSYASDVYINLTCPNGQKADILKFKGYSGGTFDGPCMSEIPLASRNWQSGNNASGSTFFGMAYDHSSSGSNACNPNTNDNAPGIGWNYCWSNNNDQGYTYAPGQGSLVYRAVNVHEHTNPYYTFWNGEEHYVDIFDSSNVAAGTQFYHPDQSFQSLIGCPLNGSWYIEVIDGTNQDNGYIFGWELALAPHLIPNPFSDVTLVTVEGPWVTTVSDTSFIFSPPDTLKHDTVVAYTFHFQDQYGCGYDTTVYLNVYAQSHTVMDTTVCGSFVWDGTTYTQSQEITWTGVNVHGCDSTVAITLTVYPIPITTIIGLPTPCVDDTANLTVVCIDSTASFLWSTGDTLPTITVTASGIYSVTATNIGDCSHDTTFTVTFSSPNQITIDTTVCDSYLWHGTLYTQTGTYIDTLTNSVGCDSVVTLNLTVNYSFVAHDTLQLMQNQLPYYFAPADTTFPVGSPAEFQFSYSVPAQNGCDSTIMEKVYVFMNYSFAYDTTVCAAALPLQWHGHTFAGSGTTTDSLQTVHGSDSVITYTVTVDALSATIGNVTHINCYGESTGAATATVTGGTAPLAYQWTNSTGSMVSVTTQISNRPAGDYTFTVTDAIGCSVTATVTLNTLHGQMSPGSISGPQTLCFGDTLGQVSGTAATGDECSYQWQISTDGNTWNPATGTNNTQNYTLLTPATSDFQLRRAWISVGCGTLYSNTLMISVWPVSSDTIYDELCEGQPYQQHGFDISGAETMGQDSLTFVEHYTSVNGCDSTVMLVLTIHALKETNLNVEICEGDGYYADGFAIPASETVGADSLLRILNLQTTDGCDSIVRLEAVIIDTALRIESLTSDFCEDMQAELVVVTNMTDYEWSTGEQLPNITVTAPGIYMVTASQGECSVSARYVIEPCIFELYLPNAISPSREDGLNDYFSISEHAQGMINLFEISIFNRWGELVYYSNNKGFQWNGEVKGQIYHQNVYNYVIEYTDSAGRPYRVTGTITVL